MFALAAASCVVVLNQQREQTVQHHIHGDKRSIERCQALPHHCTIVENGQVVVRPIPIQSTQLLAGAPPKA